MSNKSLNDEFVELQIYQREIVNRLRDKKAHVSIDIDSAADTFLHNSIIQARLMISKIYSGYTAGVEDAETQNKEDGE